jgi:hypothetical protein
MLRTFTVSVLLSLSIVGCGDIPKQPQEPVQSLYSQVREVAVSRGIPIDEMERSHDTASPQRPLAEAIENWHQVKCEGSDVETTIEIVGEQTTYYEPHFPWEQLIRTTFEFECEQGT